MKEEMKEQGESGAIMEPDEIELTLRRYAMQNGDQPLTKLLNSMFPTAEEKVKHETNPSDRKEDMKEEMK